VTIERVTSQGRTPILSISGVGLTFGPLLVRVRSPAKFETCTHGDKAQVTSLRVELSFEKAGVDKASCEEVDYVAQPLRLCEKVLGSPDVVVVAGDEEGDETPADQTSQGTKEGRDHGPKKNLYSHERRSEGSCGSGGTSETSPITLQRMGGAGPGRMRF